MNIDGIVLAAGQSRRMGSPKAQLEARPGVTFIEHAVHVLREAGCRYVVAVLSDGDDWISRLADVAGAAVVVNDKPDSQQIDSLRLGLAWLPDDADAAAILPVDFPALRVETVRTLMEAFKAMQPAVLMPTHGGQTGHPLFVARALFGEFLAEPLPHGAETIVQSHPDRALLEVPDPGVLLDVDTPDQYRKYRGN